MARSLKAGKRVTLTDVGLFSDGTAVKLVGEETFRIAKQYVDEVILVDTDAVCAAIKRCIPRYAQYFRTRRRARQSLAAKPIWNARKVKNRA